MEPFVLPEFHMPFVSTGLNLGMAEAEAALWPWLEIHGLVRSDAARGSINRSRPVLASALYHVQSDPEVLPLLGQFMAWAFLVDDEFDDGPLGQDPAACREAVAGLLAVFDGRPADNAPSRAFADLWSRLAQGRSQSWRDTLRESITSWLWTYCTEAVDRVTGRVPLPDDYRTHRRYGVGLLMFFDLNEQGTVIDLPDPVRRLNSFTSLRNAAAEQIGLFNDICSFRKERAAGYQYNLIHVMQHHYRAPLQETVHAAGSLVSDCVQRMTKARAALDLELTAAALPAPLRQDARAAADSIIALVRGNHDYHFTVERYTDAYATANTANDYDDGLFGYGNARP